MHIIYIYIIYLFPGVLHILKTTHVTRDHVFLVHFNGDHIYTYLIKISFHTYLLPVHERASLISTTPTVPLFLSPQCPPQSSSAVSFTSPKSASTSAPQSSDVDENRWKKTMRPT